MNTIKSSVLALATAMLALLPAVAPAQSTLSLIQHTVVIDYGGSNAPLTRVEDGLHAEATTLNTYALADLGLGLLRSSASQADQIGVSFSARATTELVFENIGASDIVFHAGALGASLSANFVRGLGMDTAGSATNSFSASLSGVAPSANGSAGVNYIYEAANRVGWPVFIFTPGGNQGFTAAGSASAAALSVNLSSPAFTLYAGEQLSIRLTMNSNAAAGSTAGTGWSAFTDATHSAQLAMVLPADVTLVSPQPLAWVTQVPEPGTPLLMSLGMVGIALRRLQRRRAAEVQS